MAKHRYTETILPCRRKLKTSKKKKNTKFVDTVLFDMVNTTKHNTKKHKKFPLPFFFLVFFMHCFCQMWVWSFPDFLVGTGQDKQ